MLRDNVVYDRLVDEESKYWYEARVAFAINRDRFNFYDKIHDRNPAFYGMDIEYLSQSEYINKKIIIYGAGRVGRHNYKIINNSKLADRVIGFADSEKTATSWGG